MSYIDDSADERLRERARRREQVVNTVRGWLRRERSPRLTIAALLATCAVIAVGFGWVLANCGLKMWGERALWAVIAVWPVFVLMVRWRAAIEFRRMPSLEQARSFADWGESADTLVPRGSLKSARKLTPEERIAIGYSSGMSGTYTGGYGYSRGNGSSNGGGGGGGGGDPITLLFLGGLTLGTFMVWLLIAYGASLLAETIVDAELVPSKPRLIYSFQHLDWRAEAFGATAIQFVGIALGAAMVGCSAPYLFGSH